MKKMASTVFQLLVSDALHDAIIQTGFPVIFDEDRGFQHTYLRWKNDGYAVIAIPITHGEDIDQKVRLLADAMGNDFQYPNDYFARLVLKTLSYDCSPNEVCLKICTNKAVWKQRSADQIVPAYAMEKGCSHD